MVKKKYKVVITDYFKDSIIEKKILGDKVNVVCLDQVEENKLTDEIDDADVLLVWHTQISDKTLKRLKKCKAIIRYGVGFDNINIKSARLKNIDCANTPDYGISEVADTACSMMLNLIRKINLYNFNCKKYKNEWQVNVLKENIKNPVKRLNEHKLGIIGFGRIGSLVSLRMREFGLKIGYYDPYVKKDKGKFSFLKKFKSINELVNFSSVISINCVLNDQTKSLINSTLIKQMNYNTIIVNTARGKIIKNLDCLMVGLKSLRIGGLGLDVLPEEPPNFNDKLIKAWIHEKNPHHSKIIINPHSGYYSSRSVVEMREKASKNALRVLNGKKILNKVN
tara:strand:- start:2023 stop:3033 length:1011 start_codon:yes stop_codon:yes gene_type:complete